MDTHKQFASFAWVLVSCPWPQRAQESAVSQWRIDTGTSPPSTSSSALPNLHLHSSIPPDTPSPSFSRVRLMPGGHVWVVWSKGLEKWKWASILTVACIRTSLLVTRPLCSSFGFICFTYVTYSPAISSTYLLACGIQLLETLLFLFLLFNAQWKQHFYLQGISEKKWSGRYFRLLNERRYL